MLCAVLPELPPDTAWVADLFEHPIPPSWQPFSAFSPTLASSRLEGNAKLDSVPQVPAHARNLSTGSSLPPQDVISDLAYAFATPDGPLDEVETFVMPNGGWDEAVEKGSMLEFTVDGEDKEERGHIGDCERDTTVRQCMGRRTPFMYSIPHCPYSYTVMPNVTSVTHFAVYSGPRMS
ncbi:uncharacterized protein LAESUDRAFT_318452 [Laetiporus sulphureus 93-53]|uniref:Uncharacterized protein n=1 Tax=Laetiporus sulphureus 93-53 TaxID=1314785 RepID=A0A165D110_9APHY|nr:uncharacterized protein LAESUDRAFT_318452 [Laetiporus sulphureus 93-53]KZT03919.1 hypothetical protein LAESUDRAFT_318452 [Laetiporus sulphureus 93-53]